MQDVGRLNRGGKGRTRGRRTQNGRCDGGWEKHTHAHTHTEWLFPITIRAAINDKKYAVFIGRA